jgi:hypothetical protein
MKKLAIITVGFAMAIVFLGCGSGGSSEAANSNIDDSNSTVAKAECISLPGAKPVCSDEK